MSIGTQRGTKSDRYYHEYGAYHHNNHISDYLLLFAMTTVILSGMCCLVIIISIICGFAAGKFYEMSKKIGRTSKRDHNGYNVVNVNEDQV